MSSFRIGISACIIRSERSASPFRKSSRSIDGTHLSRAALAFDLVGRDGGALSLDRRLGNRQ